MKPRIFFSFLNHRWHEVIPRPTGGPLDPFLPMRCWLLRSPRHHCPAEEKREETHSIDGNRPRLCARPDKIPAPKTPFPKLPTPALPITYHSRTPRSVRTNAAHHPSIEKERSPRRLRAMLTKFRVASFKCRVFGFRFSDFSPLPLHPSSFRLHPFSPHRKNSDNLPPTDNLRHFSAKNAVFAPPPN